MIGPKNIHVKCFKVTFFQGGGESNQIAEMIASNQHDLERFQDMCEDMAEQEVDECDFDYELYYDIVAFSNTDAFESEEDE